MYNKYMNMYIDLDIGDPCNLMELVMVTHTKITHLVMIRISEK